MKAQFKNESLIVIPETPEEIEQFARIFPEQFMRNSKHLNVRQFVDEFGNAEPNRPYLLVNGFDPSAEKVVRSRKPKEAQQAQAV